MGRRGDAVQKHATMQKGRPEGGLRLCKNNHCTHVSGAQTLRISPAAGPEPAAVLCAGGKNSCPPARPHPCESAACLALQSMLDTLHGTQPCRAAGRGITLAWDL